MISANIDNIYANLERLFISWSHAFLELIQNVERGNGTNLNIKIYQEKREIIAEYDGKPMTKKDMEAIFGIGVSNWENKEYAYGMGLLELVGRSKRVEVYSGNLYADIDVDKLKDAEYRKNWEPEKTDNFNEKVKIKFYLKGQSSLYMGELNILHSFNVKTELIIYDKYGDKEIKVIKPINFDDHSLYKKILKNGDILYVMNNHRTPYGIGTISFNINNYIVPQYLKLLMSDMNIKGLLYSSFPAYITIGYKGTNIKANYPYRNDIIKDEYYKQLMQNEIPQLLREYYEQKYSKFDEIETINSEDGIMSYLGLLEKNNWAIVTLYTRIEQKILIRQDLLKDAIENGHIFMLDDNINAVTEDYEIEATDLLDKRVIVQSIVGMDVTNVPKIVGVEYNGEKIQYDYYYLALILDEVDYVLNNGEKVKIDGVVYFENMPIYSNKVPVMIDQTDYDLFVCPDGNTDISYYEDFFEEIFSGSDENYYENYLRMQDKIIAKSERRISKDVIYNIFGVLDEFKESEIKKIEFRKKNGHSINEMVLYTINKGKIVYKMK